MSKDITKRLVEAANDADRRCVGILGRCKECGGSMKEGRCAECGYTEDSEMQMYGSEPAGMMGEDTLTVEDVEKLCPECAESMRKRKVSGVKLAAVIESGIFEAAADDDEEGILIEKEGKDGWPKKLKKGRFSKYCKSAGFDGPSEACAKKAMSSDDKSVRGMASFYMNTVKPKGKTASAVKSKDEEVEGCDECNEADTSAPDPEWPKSPKGPTGPDQEKAIELAKQGVPFHDIADQLKLGQWERANLSNFLKAHGLRPGKQKKSLGKGGQRNLSGRPRIMYDEGVSDLVRRSLKSSQSTDKK